MALNPSSGNMYGDVVTWNPLGGRCYHECTYCYVTKGRMKMVKKYQGEPWLVVSELDVDLYKCKKLKPPFTVFVCSCNDLFAKQVPDEFIAKVLCKCNEFSENTYLFQSKNPWRFADWWFRFPSKTILGTTIESNRNFSGLSKAPPVEERARMMKLTKESKEFEVMISVEPILDFDVVPFFEMLKGINPDFVSIGADSKKSDVPEPVKEKVDLLVSKLKEQTKVKIKDNLGRLMK